jgi:hypothetical protein
MGMAVMADASSIKKHNTLQQGASAQGWEHLL